MTGIAILLGAAAIGFAMSRWTQLPSIPLLLLAGVLMAALGVVPAGLLEEALVLGATFLVFVAGIELDIVRMGRQRRPAIRIGILQFLVLGTAGFLTTVALGFGAVAAMYLGLALAASSTLVVVRLLQRRRQMFEPFGRLVLGVLLVQDILVILLIPLVAGLPEGRLPVATGLLGALALLALTYICVRWVGPFLVLRLKLDEEGILIAVLAFLFVFVGLADRLGLPWIAGAFLAGVSLSAFPVSGLVRGQFSSLSDFFLAILFTSLGGLLVMPSAAELLKGLALAVVVVVVTVPLVTVLAERTGLSARASIESGLLLSQTSEFSLIVGLQGLILGHIGADVFTIIALVTVFTMMLTPFLATDRVAWTLVHYHPLRRVATPVERPPRDHILLLGCGTNTFPLLETLIAWGHDLLVVDDDPTVIGRLQQGGVPCIRGDATELAVLERAHARRAKLVISTVRRPTDNDTVLAYVREADDGVPVLVRVFDEAAAERIRRQGGEPILYADAAARDFLRWFEKWSGERAPDAGGERAPDAGDERAPNAGGERAGPVDGSS